MFEKPAIAILITNVTEGGTIRHARELASAWNHQEHNVIFILGIGHLIKVTVLLTNKQNRDYYFSNDSYDKVLCLLKRHKVRVLHVEHLLNCNPNFLKLHKDLQIPLVVSLHDYYFICPFIHLVNEKNCYCEENNCMQCLKQRKEFSPTLEKDIVNIKEWRKFWHDYLVQANMVIVPSIDMQLRIEHYFPDVKIKVVENPEIISYRSAVRRIGLIGILSVAKGSKKIKDILAYCVKHNAPIHFVLFGMLKDIVLTNEEKEYIDILGPYKEKEVYRQIRSQAIDFFWFPGVCVETYSYTLSIPVRLCIPCISTDLGAIASRIQRNNWGKTYNWKMDVEGIFRELMDFPFDSFHNPDFIIDNSSFGDFQEYYSSIDFETNNRNKKNVICENEDFTIFSLDSFLDSLDKTLLPDEFWELWSNATKKQKFRILKHLDYKYYFNKARKEGLKNTVKKGIKKLKL